jgi:hypothetical protein
MINSIHNLQTNSCPTGITVSHADASGQAQKFGGPQSADTVRISVQGRERLKGAATGMAGEKKLDFEQQKEVDKLKKTDQEVKSHEGAHMAAGAGLVMGGASYQYERGPDGRMYAVGGEVKIDTSREKNPKDTIRKMQQVKRAALAPSNPSGQDRSVAARASQIEAEARVELMKKSAEDEKQIGAEDESQADTPAGVRKNAYNSPQNVPSFNLVV